MHADDGDDYQYAQMKGVLHRMPPRLPGEGRIVAAIGWHLGHFVAQRRLGVVLSGTGFVFEREPDTLVGPDVSFVQLTRMPTAEDAYPELAPDLVVEVSLPSQSGPSIEEKSAISIAAGVRLNWVIDPARRIVRVFRADGSETFLTEQDVLDGEDVLPGFTLPVARPFV